MRAHTFSVGTIVASLRNFKTLVLRVVPVLIKPCLQTYALIVGAIIKQIENLQ